MFSVPLRQIEADEQGASAVEYGLLIAGIAAMISLAVFLLGGVVNDALFDTSCTAISNGVGHVNNCPNP